jgi:cytochrome c oxidase accessory protein FixG
MTSIKEDKAPKKVIPIQAADQPRSFYEAHKRVYPRSISGLFMRWRWALVFLTQIIFYGLPWLQWGQRQMVLFDLGARRFYLFGLVLYPQDFIYLAGLLIICALALFLFTAVAGRLWCGFAARRRCTPKSSCGSSRRSKANAARASAWTRGLDVREDLEEIHQAAAVDRLSVWTGFTFVGYFVPIRELGVELLALQGGWQIFWVLFYGFATYGNAGYMREQVCKYMCPYARFQSAMFDKDTLIVSYDPVRGENRGPRKKNVDYKAQGLGDCIDCKLCVQVCPVGSTSVTACSTNALAAACASMRATASWTTCTTRAA